MIRLVFILLIFTFSAIAQISIVTDFDETIKRTHSNYPVGVVNALTTKKVYKGMPEILNKLKKSSINKLHVLSASPRALEFNVEGLLKKFKVNYDSLTLRNLFRDGSKYNYKYNYLKNLMQTTTDDYILIGDNVSDDPEVYLKIKEEFPNRVVEIYIHKVTTQNIPKGVKVYFTSYGLALMEYESKRVEFKEVRALADMFFRETKLKNYFPKQVYCPQSLKEFSSILDLSHYNLSEQIAQRIIKFCK